MGNSSKEQIKKVLNGSGSRPMRMREIQHRLNIPKEDSKALRKTLHTMVQQGTVKRLKSGKYLYKEDIKKEDIKNDKKSGQSGRSKENERPAVKTRIVGKLVKEKKDYLVIPKDDSLERIKIHGEGLKDIEPGTLVVAQITDNSPKSRFLSGIIKNVLGKAGEIDVERNAILHEYNLPLKFSRKVASAADDIAKGDFTSEIKKRKDLRKRLTVTIDNDDAKDFDDAVSIEKTRNGYRLWISIADVSFYVQKNSPLDREASKRGNSYYLPDRVIPMLPEVLSDDLCSLVPDEDRLTKTVEMEFTGGGKIKDYRIYHSVIRSDYRLTYSWVAEMLKKRGKPQAKYRKVISSLKLMHDLYSRLKKNRMDNGELDFDMPEAELVRDDKGNIVDVVKAERNVAHGMIEEFMIAANNAVGEYMSRKQTESLYRIHERPDLVSMTELKNSLEPLGYDFDFGSEVTPKDVQRVILDARDKQDVSVVNMLILRSMKRAVYSTRDEMHFGLALEKYAHFTSPIRRYPDLIVHRIIDSLNNGSKAAYDRKTLDSIAEHCSVTERRSDEVEREAVDLERAHLMKSHLGEVFKGKVISIMPFGMFIELKGIYVEGFIPRSEMKAKKKRKWFQIGDEIKVKVTEADVERRRITLGFA